MIDFETARRHMVDGQVRTADITDPRIVSAMLKVPRERFVPQDLAALAYVDMHLAVSPGGERRLLKPMVFAKLVQIAEIAPGDRVLDVGCATGYGAAVLALVAGQVVALEQDSRLAEAARSTLADQPNVTVVTGPLTGGWPQGGPYDAIILEGATEVEPDMFLPQMKDGGRLVCVLNGPASRGMLYVRAGNDLGGRPVFDAGAPVLPGFAKAPAFAF
ncbi:MAG TPA: protein-L-isoaspartate O-methyltransferase [Pseudolabrys sp.]|nr:protein-L-isoaspartate O-methyltransferase [Pseudolabrys sp.]